PAPPTNGVDQNIARHELSVAGDDALALDQPPGDVFRHRAGHFLDVGGFGDHAPAVTGVLDEPIDALIAAHRDVGDHIDPQPRRIAFGDAALEQLVPLRDL